MHSMDLIPWDSCLLEQYLWNVKWKFSVKEKWFCVCVSVSVSVCQWICVCVCLCVSFFFSVFSLVFVISWSCPSWHFSTRKYLKFSQLSNYIFSFVVLLCVSCVCFSFKYFISSFWSCAILFTKNSNGARFVCVSMSIKHKENRSFRSTVKSM